MRHAPRARSVSRHNIKSRTFLGTMKELTMCFSRPPLTVTMFSFVVLLVSADVVLSGSHHSFSLRTFGRPSKLPRASLITLRGGSAAVFEDGDDDEEKTIDPEEEKKRLAVRKWRMDQQQLMQLRGLALSEALAKRGFPITTVVDVSTPEGDKPPASVDWDCAMSTIDEPKSCLYSFDAEPNTKVIAPINSTDWISVSALNRLRRDDPSKVETMWHNKYAILKSWFGEESEFSVMQHVGFQGFVTTVLLDSAGGIVLKSLLLASVISTVVLFMPLIEFFVSRILVSAQLWARWSKWSWLAHSALPLKLLFIQYLWKILANAFGKLEKKVRGYVVDVECTILEQNIPLTVGPGSEDPINEREEELEEDDLDVNVYDGDSDALQGLVLSETETDDGTLEEDEDYDSYDDEY